MCIFQTDFSTASHMIQLCLVPPFRVLLPQVSSYQFLVPFTHFKFEMCDSGWHTLNLSVALKCSVVCRHSYIFSLLVLLMKQLLCLYVLLLFVWLSVHVCHVLAII